MNKKYERYINYIVNELEPPYFINMGDMYGLRPEEYELVLSKVFNQPVTIKGRSVYDSKYYLIYLEYSDGYWEKSEYDQYGNRIYVENSDGYWFKKEYDQYGNRIYYENSTGHIEDRRYEESN
jgi:hypothetical protein